MSEEDAAVEALAEVLASMDGKLALFKMERERHATQESENLCSEAYMARAKEILQRLGDRKFILVQQTLNN
jgi:hypothetical protein